MFMLIIFNFPHFFPYIFYAFYIFAYNGDFYNDDIVYHSLNYNVMKLKYLTKVN